MAMVAVGVYARLLKHAGELGGSAALLVASHGGGMWGPGGAGSAGDNPPTVTEAAMACLAVDPAILLIIVGVLTFLITFCGCVGSLRENICLLQTVSPARGGDPGGTLVVPSLSHSSSPHRHILLPAVLHLPDHHLPPAAGGRRAGLCVL